jgi:hypothetical protein
MKRVTYTRKGAVVIVHNPDGLPLVWGEMVFPELKWTVTEGVFQEVQAQNADVMFVDASQLTCACGCGTLVEGGLIESAHPEDYREERG